MLEVYWKLHRGVWYSVKGARRGADVGRKRGVVAMKRSGEKKVSGLCDRC